MATHLVEQIAAKAQTVNARIVLPEGSDERVQKAALSLIGIVRPILLCKPPEIIEPMPRQVSVLNTATDEKLEEFARAYAELRQPHGMTLDQARMAVQDPIVFAALMVRLGYADGCVAGATHATGDVIRAALQIIGMAEDYTLVSSTFLMILPSGRALTYGDCGMVPNPNAEQLASIAIASATTHQQLTGQIPTVAMLSFSTKGSASHTHIDKVVEATQLAQQQAPGLALDGEFQFDAAMVVEIGQRKAPNSIIAGKANVLIFPTLDAGNIAYKITEHLGGGSSARAVDTRPK